MIRGHLNIDQKVILQHVSEEELFRFYCPNFKKLDESFCSDLRKESNASCRISDFGSFLLYKDFGSQEPGTNIWGYLMRKYRCSYHNALDKVASDFNLKTSSILLQSQPQYETTVTPGNNVNRRTVLKIKVRPWVLSDKHYWWDRYGISKKLLNEYAVKPISHFWINDNLMYAPANTYSYDYYYHNGRFLRKIYQPLNNLHKWCSNIDTTVVQGIANIPKYNDLLIITKSLKDIMCLRLLGYYAVAPNNEASWLPETVWAKFILRYPRRVIFFDNDEPGILNAEIFSERYHLPYTFIPTSEETKDISDYIHLHGIDSAKNLMRNLL